MELHICNHPDKLELEACATYVLKANSKLENLNVQFNSVAAKVATSDHISPIPSMEGTPSENMFITSSKSVKPLLVSTGLLGPEIGTCKQSGLVGNKPELLNKA